MYKRTMPLQTKKLNGILGTLVLLSAVFCGQSGLAQRGASPTATLGASIDVFAGGTYLNSDYYGREYQKGYLFGADYTWYLHRFYVVPSVELRASISPKADDDGQTVYSGGLKLEHAYGRFHPYGDLLLGAGTINFVRPNPAGLLKDNSLVYTYGGGVDVDVSRHFAVKLDYQGSRWNTGGEVKFYPSGFSGGVVYQIPFRSRHRD